ncbi:hypothetical protein CEUSTIGMA_g1159.t1 [Chlamydomonas eustigma]|uniref:Uncharacterized protein n=1 Tax=Chlamydomonas eustigma TaxID=1157962 RepID=A0A250WSJ5_9CHLO|nr:hypothetical protein CEUSTIGMA_g1159.t1 [Chlamydomonas eustigma]|eukprot:GAX73706.1 hypothetical protein CEUSTIGMA_g1159.t1 [Chlamydomonas eustigma]
MLPFYGLLCYAVCLYIILAGQRLSGDMPLYMSLLGVALAAATFAALAKNRIFFPPWGSSALQEVQFHASICTFILLMCAPLTVVHSSRLLGCAAVVAMFRLTSFAMLPLLRCFEPDLGWESVDNVGVTTCTTWVSGLLAFVVILYRIAYLTFSRNRIIGSSILLDSLATLSSPHGVAGHKRRSRSLSFVMLRYMEPFYVGMFIAGNIVFLFIGLLWTLMPEAWGGPPIVRGNAFMYACYLHLVAFHIGFGAVYHQILFRNSGVLFLVVWFLSALWQFEVLNTRVLVLLTSCALEAVGYLIKSHPQWAAQLVGGEQP